MAQKGTGKKFMNMVYGLGAAIVIIGALFKIHALALRTTSEIINIGLV